MARILLNSGDIPKSWRKFRLPTALRDRLTELLDRQDRDGTLSVRERREAEALTDLVDLLALMKAEAALGQTQTGKD